ncbi:MAG: UbiA family prenyltransferase [Pseudomonadota bacterium]
MNQIDQNAQGLRSHATPADGPAPAAALVVALDGGLVPNRLVDEAYWARMAAKVADVARRIDRDPPAAEDATVLHPEGLPYSQRVLDLIADARADGTKVYLVAPDDPDLGAAIAAHLGVFDGVWSGEEALQSEGHVYLGRDVDGPLWRNAGHLVTVDAAPALRAIADSHPGGATHLGIASGAVAPMLRAMRPHQWLKNLLVVLPAIAAHQLDAGTLLTAVLAFAAFSLVASSVYLLNDLLDLGADRAHPRKRNRPFASGALPLRYGRAMCLSLLVLGAAIGAFVGPLFLAVLAGYYVVTVLYSFGLKKRPILDICTLAGLYTLRIVAGGAAMGIPLSVWLLAFSVFLFLALASMKRQAELVDTLAQGKTGAEGRGYRTDDLPLMSQMALTSGYAAVLVLALYISSPEVQLLYGWPGALWGICLVLIYWISRAVFKTHRGEMDDDPIIFAMKDGISRLSLAVIVVFAVLGAML